MKKITLLLSNDNSIELVINNKRERSSIAVEGREYVADNLFDALLLLRERLESNNVKILCTGSRYDVYPSRMSIQMSNGRKAYQLTLGKQAEENDVVDIFTPASVEQIGTVADQRAFYKRWIESLR